MIKDVLIIDDESWFFQPFLDRFDFEKISFDYCSNGSEGLDKLQKSAYKSVVLDMKVSLGDKVQHSGGYGVQGLYILEQIKKQRPDLPVLCFTVLTDSDIVSKIEALGGKHIAKGTGDNTLIDAIKTLIKSKDNLILGNQELEKGNFEQAAAYFKEEISKSDTHVNAWVGLARAYAASDEEEDALKCIGKAIDLDKMNPRFNNMGQLSVIKAEILMDLGKHEKAEVILEKVVKENPEFIKAKILLEACKQR